LKRYFRRSFWRQQAVTLCALIAQWFRPFAAVPLAVLAAASGPSVLTRLMIERSAAEGSGMSLRYSFKCSKAEVRPPEQVCADFARTLKNYNISSISGDRFAGIWPVEQFRKFNIRYEQSAEPKSDLYQSLLPLINSRRIDLLDHPKLINQLCALERRTARGGRDCIDHPPGGHDDICNAVAGFASINNRFDSSNSFIV
jgi:hypothetical protein